VSLNSVDTTESENDVAVKLRLKRMGKKKQPTYRIVVADSRSPRDGRFIEAIGTYAPRAEPSLIAVDNAKAVAWLTEGAKPSETVRKILEVSGAWGEFTANKPAKARKPARGKAAERAARPSKQAASKQAAAKKAAEKKAAEKKAAEKKAAEKKAAEKKVAAPTRGEVASEPATRVDEMPESTADDAETDAPADGGEE
jgi:small subunit ribosomal protein S16